jgi:hypothetical protein
MKRVLVLLLALLAAQAAAAAPKPKAAPPGDNPAVDTSKTGEGEPGTTIVGERDSDVGLYLTPWKEEHANDLDPPPGLLDQTLEPIDGASFGRNVRESATVTAYRREQMQRNR